MADGADLKCKNFFKQFRDKDTLQLVNFDAANFARIWNHYDSDGNGYIEGEELDEFLREFIASVVPGDVGAEVVSDAALKDMREEFMIAYDENEDNRIEIGELAQMLPTEENFLLLFRRDNPLNSSVDFMRIWRQFDADNSGFIEGNELKEFLVHLMKERKPPVVVEDEKMIEYTKTMLELFDRNGDGKLQLSEMGRLLPVRENFLSKLVLKNSKRLSSHDVDRIFRKYDTDKNDSLENDELLGFLKDLLELSGDDFDDKTLTEFRDAIMAEWDTNNDGKIERDELKLLLAQQKRIAEEQAVMREANLKYG